MDFFKIILFIIDGSIVICAYILFWSILKEISKKLNIDYNETNYVRCIRENARRNNIFTLN